MPSLGADMEEGKLVEWLVKPGDRSRGDIVAVVETQKGAIEIEIFEAGMIAANCAEPGDIARGAPLARLAAGAALAAPCRRAGHANSGTHRARRRGPPCLTSASRSRAKNSGLRWGRCGTAPVAAVRLSTCPS